MSSKPNYRRGEKRRTDNGPRYEGGGSDNSSVARGRRNYRTLGRRLERRTGTARGVVRYVGRWGKAPEIDDPGDE